MDKASTLAIVALTGGTASYTTKLLSIGTHFISVVYSGDSNFIGSTSPTLKQVVKTTIGGGLAALPGNPGSQPVDQAIAALGDDAPDETSILDLALEQVSSQGRRPRGARS
jgi:hypothetical protein